VLPENYVGISFNEDRVCNFCIEHKEKKYYGDDVLKKKILSFNDTRQDRDKRYDCVLALSGGRDSSYLLYYLVKVLKLNVLAYSVDNGFIPEQTKINLKRMTDLLNVKLVIEEHDQLSKCIKHHIMSWIRKPSRATIGLLCTGCKHGMILGMSNFAHSNNVPLLIMGSTPFEGKGYKLNLLRYPSKSGKIYSIILGYIMQVLRNPKLVMNMNSAIEQFKEFYYIYNKKNYLNIFKKRQLKKITPYSSHIRWEEDKIVSTISSKLNWEKNADTESTWRGDCDVALLKLYLYKKLLGFNDKDDGLSCLIRDNQITRDEALSRLGTEGDIPDKAIENFLNKLEVDFNELNEAINKIKFN